MVDFEISDELKYTTPFSLYMEYILLKYNDFLKKQLKDEKISSKDLLYLYNLFYHKNISQKELAELMYVSEANIAKMIKKLDKYGLIIKRKDEENKSRNKISLSEKGEMLLLKFRKITLKWESSVAKECDIDNMDEFKNMLYKISENSVDI